MSGLIYEEIAKDIKEQLAKKNNYADLHYYYALFLGYWGQYNEALRETNRSLDLNPRYRKALEYKEALETMIHHNTPVPADSPNPHPIFHETHKYAALYYEKKKRFETAEDCIEKSYALSKNEADYQMQLGMLYEMKGDLFQAASHLEKAIELDADSWKPYSILCHIYTLQDRLEDARNIMRQVVNKYPLYPDLHYHLALLLIESGEFAEAIAQLKKAIEINPKYYYAQYHLGTAYLLNNQPQEAEAQFLLMIAKGWEPEGIFLDIARAQLEAGKWDAAEQSSVRAMERDPSNPEPFYLMAQICTLKKDFDGASHYSAEAKKREFSL